jgi:chromosomal replication initiator protein
MQAWEQFLTALESDLGAETVNKWLRTLKIVHYDAGNLYLEASDSFQISWFEEHVREKAKKKLVNNNFNPIKIHISSLEIETQTPSFKSSKHQYSAPLKSEFNLLRDLLDPHALFSHFVTCPSNQMSLECLKSICCSSLQQKNPISLAQFNPVYIYGPSGCGKSHLLMAACNELNQSSIKACYVKMETFTENVVSAIRSGNMQEFRSSYRNIDVLIVDDVHILAKKTATQEEFFHTFNTLHTLGKQIILSSNCSAQNLQDIEPRLTSRFEWGLPLHILPYQNEEVIAIINKKLYLLDFPLQNEVIEHIAQIFSHHLKSVHKAIDALILRLHTSKASIKSEHIKVNDVDTMLKDLIDAAKIAVLNPSKIVQAVAEIFGIKSSDILGKSQSHDCSFPRQIAMYLCRQNIKMPFTQIGQFFQRDHSTVISSVSCIKEKIENKDVDLCATLSKLQKKMASIIET